VGEFRYIGTNELHRRGTLAVREAVRISLRELKGKVIVDSPVDTGTMEGTTRIQGPWTGGFVTRGRVIQGGGAASYTTIVHQKWSHKGYGPARQVQRPLLRHIARHLELLRISARDAF
jgi:hypothetical protein